MIVLAVDTTGPIAGVAIARDERVLAEIALNVGLTHSQTIQPAIDSALGQAGMTIDDIDRYACVAGPGSFTGVRIGVCLVKALARATEKPVVALDALTVLAWQAWGFPGTILSMLDARRDQVYAAAYRTGNALPEVVVPGTACALYQFLDTVPKGPVVCLGDGALAHANEIKLWRKDALIPPEPMCLIRPGAAATLAMRLDAPIDHRALKPIYLRKPQAERERAERENRHD